MDNTLVESLQVFLATGQPNSLMTGILAATFLVAIAVAFIADLVSTKRKTQT